MADIGIAKVNGFSGYHAERPGYLAAVLTRDAERIWPRALPVLGKAFEYADGCHTADSVLDDIQNDMARLWIFGAPVERTTGYPLIVRAAMVSRIDKVADGNRFTLFALGAEDWNEIAPILSGFEKMAKAMGCNACQLQGRDGWIRRLPDYEKIAVVLRKRL